MAEIGRVITNNAMRRLKQDAMRRWSRFVHMRKMAHAAGRQLMAHHATRLQAWTERCCATLLCALDVHSCAYVSTSRRSRGVGVGGLRTAVCSRRNLCSPLPISPRAGWQPLCGRRSTAHAISSSRSLCWATARRCGSSAAFCAGVSYPRSAGVALDLLAPGTACADRRAA